VALSQYADVSGTWDDSTLALRWTTSLKTEGGCELPRSKAGEPSELVPLNRD
jgi:hypothetical protein